MYTAQLEAALRRHVPDLDWHMATGDSGQRLQWMSEHVHCHGKLYRPKDVIVHATGRPPSTADYIQSLTRKYAQIQKL